MSPKNHYSRNLGGYTRPHMLMEAGAGMSPKKFLNAGWAYSRLTNAHNSQ